MFLKLYTVQCTCSEKSEQSRVLVVRQSPAQLKGNRSIFVWEIFQIGEYSAVLFLLELFMYVIESYNIDVCVHF